MPRRVEVWQVDLGLAAKVRPVLVLTDPPTGDNERNMLLQTQKTEKSSTLEKPLTARTESVDACATREQWAKSAEKAAG